MRQVFVEEFDYSDLPSLLRQMADWLEKQKDLKVWNLIFESYDDADFEEVRWAGYCYGIPFPLSTDTKNSSQKHPVS